MSKPIDLTGLTFGRLKVISYNGNNEFRKAMWLCQCECGAQRIIESGVLRRLKEPACRSCIEKRAVAEDLIGKTFGKLVVVKRLGSYRSTSGSSSPLWVTTCLLCGGTRIISTQHLKQLKVKTCKACGSPTGRAERKDALPFEYHDLIGEVDEF